MRLHPLFCSVMLLLAGCHAGSYQGPVSDHFDGVHFYNPATYAIHPVRAINQPDRSHLSVNSKLDPVRMTFINHATILIQSDHFTLLTDPIWSCVIGPVSGIGPVRWRPPAIAFDRLPPIDVVLISHNHYDHLDLPTLIRLNNRFHPVFIVPLGNKRYLEDFGIQHVIELDWWQSVHIKQATITMLPSHHWSSRWYYDLKKTLWGSYGISLNGKKIYFGGDTSYDDHFKAIHDGWGTADLALLPIGGYSPRFYYKTMHMNPEDAIKADEDLHAVHSIGMHYGTFRLSFEGINEPEDVLKEELILSHANDGQFITVPDGRAHYYVLK